MRQASGFPALSRRQALAGMAAAMALGPTRLSFAAGTGSGPRLVLVNVLGGLDCLNAVVPYGDPYLAGLRAGLVPKKLLQVDSFFALDPNLKNLAGMFAAGQALAVHAVGPVVQTRSHFLGQDFLQGGSTVLTNTGWLNAALGLISANGSMQAGLTLDSSAPLVARGNVATAGWAGDPYPVTSPNLETIIETDASNDLALGPAINVAFQDRDTFQMLLQGHTPNNSSTLARLAQVAGLCLASPYGPSVAVLETTSVDTHSDQNGRLPALLADLDQVFQILKASLGSAWGSTVVMTMTEFGRTAYENGTTGTDHGTGFAVFLAGGAVAGGRVVVDGGWPGLGPTQLFQGRDLAPTCDFRQVAMSVLFDHLGIASSNQDTIFPGSDGLVPLGGLVNG